MNENTIAGYRTIRPMGEGPRSQTILVRAEGRGADDGAAGLRLIKCFNPEVPAGRILSEIECATRAPGDHVQSIDDLAAAPDGRPVVVFDWQSAGTLRRLMRDRTSLRIGEAITILAPLIAALNQLHSEGIALGAVSVDTVHFNSEGSPFFAEWGHASVSEIRPTSTALHTESAFRDDRLQFALVACGVLSAITAEREKEGQIADLVEWLSDTEQIGSCDWELQCECRLFALGAPEPVLLTAEPDDRAAQSVPARLDGSPTEAPLGKDASAEWGAVLALPVGVQRALEGFLRQGRNRLRTFVSAARAWCAPVRKRTWFVAALGIAALAIAAAIILVSEQNASSEPTVGVAGETLDDEAMSSGSAGVTGEAQLGDGSAAELETDDSGASPSGLDEDPVIALAALLAARDDCLRDLSIECLAAVSRSDSPAFAADSAAIEAVLAGAELSTDSAFDAATATVTQRLGDSVLFQFETPGDKSEPASLLLVKGEAGWRVRSYVLPH
ncbi:hypothetical protein ESZ53_03300 [Salinibacterium sp. UTAS2018]|uniref:hypothetical protein n=1 Tax=Salinibacterium sp. UTAS2018 TaxID=2508880 RepID=UPI0010096590|nr:hypothetical protein [Salinibacterium sp. UTAS2018]QAV69552.1 hypothetical protein ESZ53_03300 [Salinibacterium sp. UTAS2018]